MIITSIVHVYDDDITVIEKSNKSAAIVILCDDCVIVTNSKLHGRHPHIAAVWDMSNNSKDVIVEKYRHVIAKMIGKDQDSKYFGHPKYNEHFKNGRPGNLQIEDIENRCFDAMQRCGYIV